MNEKDDVTQILIDNTKQVLHNKTLTTIILKVTHRSDNLHTIFKFT